MTNHKVYDDEQAKKIKERQVNIKNIRENKRLDVRRKLDFYEEEKRLKQMLALDIE